MKLLNLSLVGSLILQGALSTAAADPLLDSWITPFSGRYARSYTNDAAKTAGTPSTTWSNGSQTQSLPSYSGVQEIYSSSSWVYILTTGLGIHTMGPWYNDANRTTLFVNMPVNQKALARFPRSPSVPATKTTVQGEGGYFVDGVIMFDARDAVSYINSTGQDGSPPGGGGTTGDGIWNRDAYVNEAITFDPALAHQQNTGIYHYHANPIATRYLLGDHVDLNATTKAYSESTNAPTRHSPIVGWAKDGYPLYGPYGYSVATNAASGVRRMVPGFVPRNGQNGTANLSATGRTTLPAWAARAANRSTTLSSSEYGPAVSTSFPLGRYTEDNDYLGDLGQTQGLGFDLDEYNGRFCVTPEFPGGTYAYFVCITSNGLPNYPYNLGRQYYGNPTGGAVQSLSETVTTNFVGGTNSITLLSKPAITNSSVTLTWSGVEGGTYRVESSTNLSAWSVIASNVASAQITGTQTVVASGNKTFYRVIRTSVAAYDANGGGGGGGGGTGSEGIASVSPTSANRGATGLSLAITPNTSFNPPPPPNNVAPTSVTLTRTGAATLTATSSSRNSTTGVVTAIFNIPAGATPGAYTVNASFGPNTWSLTGGFTVN